MTPPRDTRSGRLRRVTGRTAGWSEGEQGSGEAVPASILLPTDPPGWHLAVMLACFIASVVVTCGLYVRFPG